MKKKYLITGAAGFIGSALAKKHISLGNEVYTIDNLSTGYEENIPSGVKFIKGDCYDSNVINELKGIDFDAIYHIAGQSSGEISFENPKYDLNTNTLSTLLLLEFAKQQGIERFVYASTMSVYGDQEKQPVNENALTIPKSFYAVGKLASEQYLKIFHQLGVKSTALRLFNVYGPGQNLNNLKQGMVSIFMAQALRERNIDVKGSLDRFRDFVFIDDVVDAFLKAECRDDAKQFEVYNICSGVKTTVGEVVDLIRSNFSESINVNVKNGTPGDQFGIYGDNIKAKEKLEWNASTGFKEGINKMFNWAKKSS